MKMDWTATVRRWLRHNARPYGPTKMLNPEYPNPYDHCGDIECCGPLPARRCRVHMLQLTTECCCEDARAEKATDAVADWHGPRGPECENGCTCEKSDAPFTAFRRTDGEGDAK